MMREAVHQQNTAIVLGSRGVNAVGLIRSLGRAGVRAVFASASGRLESKWESDYLRLPRDKTGWPEVLSGYAASCRSMPAVFPADDEAAFFLDENHVQLSRYCYISHASGNLRRLADKRVMAELAERNGLAVPESVLLPLGSCPETPPMLPLILKPHAAYAGGKGDIRICRNDEEYAEAVARLREKRYTEILAQRLLDDAEQFEIGLMGISLPDGTVVIPCTIRKIRSYPAGRGSTSYARLLPGIAYADGNALKSFVRSTGYVGIFDIEMMISGGSAWFIEINYRNGQYGYAPTVAGYNLPANWLAGITGGEVAASDTVREIYYMNERDDFRHVRERAVPLRQWVSEFRRAQARGMYCPGDQRPFIRQYVKIPDRVRLKAGKLRKRLSDILFPEEWNIAYRTCGSEKLYEPGGTAQPFTVLKNSFRYWAADPFVISDGERDYVFFEMFDRLKGKGAIGYRTIENGKIGKMQLAYEAPKHLSFPFVFKDNGDFYMLPESSESRELVLLRSVGFPSKWVTEKTWMQGRKLCDSVILNADGKTYLFTQELDEGYRFDSLSLYEWTGQDWVCCGVSPIVKDPSRARMAGNILNINGRLIRVSQDCTYEYGKSLSFHVIAELSSDAYSEEPTMRIGIEDIKCNGISRVFCGIHTYNANDSYEVIDLKRKPMIHPCNVLSLFYRLLRKL